ncbi:hypothetical protein ACFVFI_36980 [Streptomyces sp. NPDC057705]|uniref:hypothetical protein n=1 Tax=Streptomyces sp. NPDC057705 TaxID=3346222 RepID=UPI00368496C3
MVMTPDTGRRLGRSARQNADRERSLRLLQAIDEAGDDVTGLAGRVVGVRALDRAER